MLAHHVGLATVGGGSFAGGRRGVRQTLAELGVDSRPATGGTTAAGCRGDNRLAPATLLAVLRVAAAAEHPELRAVLTGLPVAGFTGSLEYRFDDAAARRRGRVRAKTGTLTGHQRLAGIVDRPDGRHGVRADGRPGAACSRRWPPATLWSGRGRARCAAAAR